MNELRLNDLFDLDPFDNNGLRSLLRPWRVAPSDSLPAIRVDVSEADGHYVVNADIPGVKKEDIDVRIDDRLVTISAEVKREKEEKKGERVLRSERQYGYASRSFTLADPVDEAKAEARYESGVLQLKLPKRAQTERRRLAVS
jgi:HSP20 family protein